MSIRINKSLIIAAAFFAGVYIYAKPTVPMNIEDNIVIVDEDEEPEYAGKLEYMTASWCSPCKKMKADKALEAARALGYEVVENSGLGRRYPAFRLTVNGRSKSWTGYSSKSRFLNNIKKYQEQLSDARSNS